MHAGSGIQGPGCSHRWTHACRIRDPGPRVQPQVDPCMHAGSRIQGPGCSHRWTHACRIRDPGPRVQPQVDPCMQDPGSRAHGAATGGPKHAGSGIQGPGCSHKWTHACRIQDPGPRVQPQVDPCMHDPYRIQDPRHITISAYLPVLLHTVLLPLHLLGTQLLLDAAGLALQDLALLGVMLTLQGGGGGRGGGKIMLLKGVEGEGGGEQFVRGRGEGGGGVGARPCCGGAGQGQRGRGGGGKIMLRGHRPGAEGARPYCEGAGQGQRGSCVGGADRRAPGIRGSGVCAGEAGPCPYPLLSLPALGLMAQAPSHHHTPATLPACPNRGGASSTGRMQDHSHPPRSN